MRPDLARSLRMAGFFGLPFVVLQNVRDRAVMQQRERRRLIQPTGIRLPEHSRRATDGFGEGVAA